MLKPSGYHVSQENILKEEQLIEEAKKSPSAFEAIYNKYYRQILSFVYRRVESKEVAFDITQQVFVNALVNLGKYQHRGVPFSSWLYRIALNELNKTFRSKKVNGVLFVEQDGLEKVRSEIEENSAETDQLLMKAISLLKDDEATLIEMRFFEERPFKEIAEILSITESTAKQRVYKILEKLKDLITRH